MPKRLTKSLEVFQKNFNGWDIVRVCRWRSRDRIREGLRERCGDKMPEEAEDDNGMRHEPDENMRIDWELAA